MTDLSILKNNFNKLIESYEKNDVTIENIRERSMGSRLVAAITAEKIEHDILEGKILVENDGKTTEIESSKFIDDLIKVGLDIGFTDFMESLANEKFMEEKDGQGTVEEKV